MRISAEDLDQLRLHRLPTGVEDLLDRLQSPPRLVAHLTLVHDVAVRIVDFLDRWPGLPLQRDEVLFGAATHDIGKTVHVDELDGPGHRHEAAGRELLHARGYDARLARFAISHADRRSDDRDLEDLLVALADKVWKGKREADLEERVAQQIAKAIRLELWDVLLPLQDSLDEIAAASPLRLEWQQRFPSH